MKRLFSPLIFMLCLFYFQALLGQSSGSWEGVMKGRKGNILEILPRNVASLPQAGTECEMSKQFEQKLGNMTMNGWLGVAKVKILTADDKLIRVELLEEKSEILVNGEKVNHFLPGKVMKLDWGGEEEEEIEAPSDSEE